VLTISSRNEFASASWRSSSQKVFGGHEGAATEVIKNTTLLVDYE
jgi:hypothetical protein